MSRQHYDNPLVISHGLGLGGILNNATAGTLVAAAIAVPPNMTHCKIIDITGACSTAFDTPTTDLIINLGTAGDVDRYMSFHVPDNFLATNAINLSDDTDAITAAALDTANAAGTANPYGGVGVINVGSSGEDISQIEVSYVIGTGGGATGIIQQPTLVLAWW